MLEDYDTQARAIKDEMLRFVWWMRGGLSYDDALYLGHYENEIVRQIIKENMETTKNTGMPFF